MIEKTIRQIAANEGKNLMQVFNDFIDYIIHGHNLMMHGLPGEVICHDTLSEPDTCKFFYVVNEGLFPLPGGLPTIRKLTDPARPITLRVRDVD